MTPQTRADSELDADSTDSDRLDADSTDSDSTRTDSTDTDNIDAVSTLDVVVEAGRLASLLDGPAAIVDECLARFDEDGLVLRARDPADVAMAELSLPATAFDAYDANGQRFGIALDRLRDAVSMADDDRPVRVVHGDSGRLRVESAGFEYALAPIDPDAVRRVDWIEGEATAARVVVPAPALQRAVDAADLVADHATFAVGPGGEPFRVSASGDTDDVEIEFDEDDFEEIGDIEGRDGHEEIEDIAETLAGFDEFHDPAESGTERVESIYSVQYLQGIVGAIPREASVALAFIGAPDRSGYPLAVGHSFADGAGTGRWLLAPRLRR